MRWQRGSGPSFCSLLPHRLGALPRQFRRSRVNSARSRVNAAPSLSFARQFARVVARHLVGVGCYAVKNVPSHVESTPSCSIRTRYRCLRARSRLVDPPAADVAPRSGKVLTHFSDFFRLHARTCLRVERDDSRGGNHEKESNGFATRCCSESVTSARTRCFWPCGNVIGALVREPGGAGRLAAVGVNVASIDADRKAS